MSARDYLGKDWKWKPSGNLTKVKGPRGRLAQFGPVRPANEFSWQPWFESNADRVLSAFADFIEQLSLADPKRHAMFVAPSAQHPHIDLVAELARIPIPIALSAGTSGLAEPVGPD